MNRTPTSIVSLFLTGSDSAMQWEGPHGITASVDHPVLARLAAPTLHPDLARHLEK